MRRFNRFYTRTIGVLGDGIQRTQYTLTEARLLWELAQADQAETVELRQRLGLDAGYVSRIFARFEGDGLVRLERSTVDARRQVVSLTPAGRRAFKTLSDNAVEDMGALLGKLGETDQRRLLAAMSTIERLWDGPVADDRVVIRAPLPGDLGWVVQRHGELYADEYQWNDEFEALIAGIVADFVKARKPGRDAAWIAQIGDAPAGCVFCVAEDDVTARLRLLLVEPWARGRGVGARLVGECVEFARRNGYQKMVLWTNAELHAARNLYEKAGFELVSEERGESFGRPQVFQNWSLTLVK